MIFAGNQWTGFYMTGTTVIKELMEIFHPTFHFELSRLYLNLLYLVLPAPKHPLFHETHQLPLISVV